MAISYNARYLPSSSSISKYELQSNWRLALLEIMLTAWRTKLLWWLCNHIPQQTGYTTQTHIKQKLHNFTSSSFLHICEFHKFYIANIKWSKRQIIKLPD